MSQSSTYLAEITPDAAEGEIAHIYEEIRRLTGGPLVALIFRHLATFPGVLESVWRQVSPLLASGEVQEGAWALARNAWDGAPPPADAGLIALDATERRRAADVIAAYNRANPVNFAVVCALRAAQARGRDSQPATRQVLRPWSPPARIGAIAAIPSMQSLDERARRIVDAFAKDAAPGAGVLVPTLYRHIAHWPALLEYCGREVAPRLAAGAFDAPIARFRSGIEALAESWADSLAAAPPGAGSDERLMQVCERFAGVIPEMVVVGHFIGPALD